MGRQTLKECVHIGGILADLLKGYRRTSGRELMRICDLWADVVGNPTAENARPVAYKNRLLWVNVTCSVWMQQLQFLKEDMIVRVNDALGSELVADIKFKIGRV